MAVSFCALTQRTWSCAMRLAIPVSSVSICFLILLIRLRLKDRNSAQLTCARRFCSASKTLLKCRRCASYWRKRFCSAESGRVGFGCIGLGQDAGGPRILPHPNGLHQGDCKIVLFQALQQRLLVAATGFTD